MTTQGCIFYYGFEGVTDRQKEILESGLKVDMTLKQFLRRAESLLRKATLKTKDSIFTSENEDAISYIAEAMMREACKTDDMRHIIQAGKFATARACHRIKQHRQASYLFYRPQRMIEEEAEKASDFLSDTADTIRKLTLRLPKRERQVILLVLDNMSMSDIAEKLNTSEKNVRNKYHSAVKSLKKMVKEND